MSLSSRILAPLLMSGLLLPTSTALAQGGPIDGWSDSDDGLVFATNDDLDTPPGWSLIQPVDFPAALSGLPGPDRLYRIEGTLESGTRIANLHDGATLAWLDQGRTPVLAKAVVGIDEAAWARQQHIVSTPAGCSDAAAAMDLCIHPWLTAELADMAAPRGSPVAPAPFADGFEPGIFASTGVTDQDGTLFSFAGGSSVGTSVKVRNDDTIVVRGDVDLGDGLGGQLRGFDATVFPMSPEGPAAIKAPGWGSLETRAREVRRAWSQSGKVLRNVFECPATRTGYVVSQFLIGGVGSTPGPAVDRKLEGGAPVFISEVIPFDCGPGPGADGMVAFPADGPAAALVCGSTRPLHQPFTSTRDGRQVTSNSSLLQRYLVVTVGLSPERAASLIARVGSANGGSIFSVGLEGVQLESTSRSDVTVWLGESRVGIDTYGPKPFADLQLSSGQLTFDLADQQRSLLGDAFDVGPSQKPVTNCPGFDFTFSDLEQVFPDGFESGDISAWSEPTAD